MRPGRISRIPYCADLLARIHFLSLADGLRAHMAVERDKAVAVIDGYPFAISIAAVVADTDDFSSERRVDRRAGRRGEIDAVVLAGFIGFPGKLRLSVSLAHRKFFERIRKQAFLEGRHILQVQPIELARFQFLDFTFDLIALL